VTREHIGLTANIEPGNRVHAYFNNEITEELMGIPARLLIRIAGA